jgi:hypothetical protein
MSYDKKTRHEDLITHIDIITAALCFGFDFPTWVKVVAVVNVVLQFGYAIIVAARVEIARRKERSGNGK